MIKIKITDPKTGRQATVVDGKDEEHALVVATRQLKTYENRISYFINDDYGVDMNQNALSSGIPEEIHNGIDSVLWTASDIVGGDKTTFDSTDRYHSGTRSIKIDNSPINDIFQFTKSSDLNASDYITLTAWINVDKDWKLGDNIEIYGWDTGTGLQVGNSVSLQNYFQWDVFDVWHQISIPLSDFGDLSNYTTLDALRVEIVTAEGKSPKFYIDDIQFEETGAPIEYIAKPVQGAWSHIYNMLISVAGEYDGSLISGTMPNIPYDSILGASSINIGIRWSQWINGSIKSAFVIKKTMDAMELPSASIRNYGDDGTNVWFTLNFEFTEPLILKPENDDYLSVVISDDLTDLSHLRMSLGCKTEIRE